MTPNDQNYIRVRPHLDFFSFFEVSHEDDDGENNQEDIEAYDWDGSIDRRHRSNVEGRRAVIDVGSYYFFHYTTKGQLAHRLIQVETHPRTLRVDYTSIYPSLPRARR
jgi:hypothetical protein